LLKKSWLFLLPLVAGLLLVGASPGHAAGPSWTMTGVESIGCQDGDWGVDVNFSGFDGDNGGYNAHTTVTAGGLVYMNEEEVNPGNGDETWGLFSDPTYGPETGTWPIPADTQMKVVFSLEKPKGTVVSSWTMIARSCDSGTLLFNAADLDQDGLPDSTGPADTCPSLAGSTASGCPVRDRTLTLNAKHHPNRVVGTLSAPGFPALSVGRTVTIWKVRPGPDKNVATRTTNSLGKFKARVGPGRYYATSPDYIAPTAGEALADTSSSVRVH
jgi:hypothetical protein